MRPARTPGADRTSTSPSAPQPPGPLSPAPSDVEAAQGARSESFDVLVQDIRASWSTNTFLLPRLEDLLRRQLGLPPLGIKAATVAALVGISLRLLLPLAVTLLIGTMAGIPWWRWTVVAVILGLGDATAVARHAPVHMTPESLASSGALRPGQQAMLQSITALVPTIVRESDLRQLADFTYRWYRLPVVTVVAAGIASTILLAGALAAPTGMRQLPVGTVVLLALLSYDFGELVFWNLFTVPFMAIEARFDHQLFWPSPIDSVEVQDEIRVWARMQLALGVVVTTYSALAIVLVSWSAPVVVPLAAAITLLGYLTTLASMFVVRRSISRITHRIRDRHLARLQRRLEAYDSRLTELSPDDAEEVARLLALHTSIRDAPTSPRRTQTWMHAAVALILPTLMFVITVFGEVSAERLLDQLLP